MREFRKTTGRSLRPIVWRTFIDDKDPKTYVVQWGLENGAIQETRDTPGTCGVDGHSDFQSAEEYAVFCMNREIRKKTEQGYVEFINGKPINEVANSIDFSKPLPKNLCFYKPKKEISSKALKELASQGRAIWTLKRDGMMHITVKRNNNWEIYSRRMDLVSENYPHILKALESLNIPNNSILLGEMCFLNDNGSDNFKNVSKICRSKSDLSLAYQGFQDFPKRRENESILGKVCYYVFDVAFYAGRDLISNDPTWRRMVVLKEIFETFNNRLKVSTGRKASHDLIIRESKLRETMLRQNFVAPVKIYHTSPDDDLDLAKELKAEGFVLLDAFAKYGNKAYSFDGKAQRPNGIWKRKPSYEDEFIVTGYYEGTGRNRGKLGGFTIEQVHPDNNNRMNCGKCGGGLSDQQRVEFMSEGDNLIGKTVKIEFDSRQPENNGVYALRFPEFKGFADKEQDECIAQDDWPPRG